MKPAPASPRRLGVIRYMGNKLALLPHVRACVEELCPEGSLVVDPMAGSHAVTYALKDRHRLLASDVQHYSAVVGRAWVENVSVHRFGDRPTARLLARADRLAGRDGPTDGHGEGDAPRGFLETSYADTYLGRHQCRQLDALRAAIDDLHPSEDDPRRWLACCAVLTAACRAQASPGHFAQFLRPDHPRVPPLRRIDLLEVVRHELREAAIPDGDPGNRCLALSWRDLAAREEGALGPAALWYLDSPYTRDQYSRFYHLLETLARGDRPSLRHGARYRDDRFRSAFCSPRTAASELRELLGTIRRCSPGAAVLLSYSSRGILDPGQLLAAADGFEVVLRRKVPDAYSTQGKGRLEGVTELLLGFRPRRGRG